MSLLLWLLENQQAKQGRQRNAKQMSFMGDVLGMPDRGKPQPAPPILPPAGPQGRGVGPTPSRFSTNRPPGMSREALMAQGATDPNILRVGLQALASQRALKAGILSHDLAERRQDLAERIEDRQGKEKTYLLETFDPEGKPHPFRVGESDYNKKVTELRKRGYHVSSKQRLYPVWKKDKTTGGIIEDTVIGNKLPTKIKAGWIQGDYQAITKPSDREINYTWVPKGQKLKVVEGSDEHKKILALNKENKRIGKPADYLRGVPIPKESSKLSYLNTIIKTGEGIIAKGLGLDVAFMDKWDTDKQKDYFDSVKFYHDIIERKPEWQNAMGVRKAADFAIAIKKLAVNNKTGELIGLDENTGKWINIK